MVKFPDGDATLGVVIHVLAELCSSLPMAYSDIGGNNSHDRSALPAPIKTAEETEMGEEQMECEGEETLRSLDRLLTSLASKPIDQTHWRFNDFKG